VDISKYIADLLYYNDCVIIPGLGAFVASYKSAQIDDNQKTLHPPSKDITFNFQLKNNDKVLVDYIAEQESISSFDAIKKVEEFREAIQYRLEKGEEIVFEGLGTLKLDDENKPHFSPYPDNNFLLDSYGLGSVSLNPEKSVQKGNVVVSFTKEPREKSKTWLLFLFIPVAAIAVFLYLNIFTNKDEPNKPKSESSEELIDSTNNNELLTDIDSSKIQSSPSNTIISDTIVPAIDEQVIEEPIQAPEINYYLIGGSFTEQENADKFFAQVEQFGYKPIHLGKQGRFFTVAIGGYSTLDKANADRNSYLDRKPDSGVYILKVDN